MTNDNFITMLDERIKELSNAILEYKFDLRAKMETFDALIELKDQVLKIKKLENEIENAKEI